MLKGVVIDDTQLLNDKLAEWQEPQTNDQEGLITRR